MLKIRQLFNTAILFVWFPVSMSDNRDNIKDSPKKAENPGAKFHFDNLKLRNRKLNNDS
ncbi:hypothetical protein CIPAW_12G134200 [Carya illinoinensis]|uniref:Uncharacterized protein n=1 Tax=Carya illinoinensis TaxID=32201 RepID=A0A8T1NWZ9_CARIL|nr:hypothetical protein CIPAW_12G134200 [Carya illinoinensis]